MCVKYLLQNLAVLLAVQVLLCYLGTAIGGEDFKHDEGDDIREEVLVAGDGTQMLSSGSPNGFHLKTSPGKLQASLAKKLLQKWGYMEMEFADGHWDYVDWRMELDSPGSSVEHPLHSLKSFDSEDSNEDSWSNDVKNKFQSGLKSFQKRFDLPVTGELDSRTDELLQQPRCSVPDNEVGSVYQAGESVTLKKQKVKDVSHKTSGKYGKKPTLQKPTKLDLDSGKKMPSKQTLKNVLTTRMPVKPTASSTKTPSTSDGNIVRHTPTIAVNLGGSVEDDLPHRTELEVDGSNTTEVITEAMNVEVTDIATERVHVDNVMVTDLQLQEQRTDHSHLEERRRRSPHALLQQILHRSKRTRSYVCNYGFSPQSEITWRIMTKSGRNVLTDSQYLSTDSTRSVVQEGFRRWAEVSTLTFKEDNSQTNVDVWIQFISDSSTTLPFGCNQYVWCFYGTEMAASFYSYVYSNGQYGRRAYIYFRDDPLNPWTSMDLLAAAVHEIGHIMCLGHSDIGRHSESIMSPYVMYYFPTSDLQVPIDDAARSKAKSLYGACTDPFVAFDWIHTENGNKLYSTYMFRGDHYWQWENSNKRTRYADPRITYSSSEWPNVPSNLQAVVQVLPRGSSTNDLYFFAGGQSYLYDQNNKRVIKQGSIRSQWGAKDGSSTSIPTNIKAAYFDKRDGNVYFFDSTHVYEYDYSAKPRGCCNSIQKISTAFPGRYSSYPALENNIDLAYYSVADRKLYFFKGEDYWESTYNPSSTTVYNRVNRKQYGWHNKWDHICEVD